MNNVLVGTFVEGKYPRKAIKDIYERFACDKVFVFVTHDEGNKDKFLLTYDITKNQKREKLTEHKDKYRNTILLQRNRKFNTMYTINSLNKIIEEQNGRPSKDFKVDWSGYKNSVVLIDRNDEIRKMSIDLFDVVELNLEENK